MKKPTKKTGAKTAARKTIMKPADESGKLVGIAAKIMKLSAAAEPAPSWKDKVNAARVVCEDTSEAVLRAGQAMRDAGRNVDFANMSICMGAEDIAADREKTDAGLAKISRATAKKKKGYGLKDDEYWPLNEAPDDVKALLAAFTERCRRIEADVLREFGENDMADALLADEAAFNAKYREPGRLAHFGNFPAEGIPDQAK